MSGPYYVWMTGHVQLKFINRLANKTMSSSFFICSSFFIGDGKFCCVFIVERRCLHSQNRPLSFDIYVVVVAYFGTKSSGRHSWRWRVRQSSHTTTDGSVFGSSTVEWTLSHFTKLMSNSNNNKKKELYNSEKNKMKSGFFFVFLHRITSHSNVNV